MWSGRPWLQHPADFDAALKGYNRYRSAGPFGHRQRPAPALLPGAMRQAPQRGPLGHMLQGGLEMVPHGGARRDRGYVASAGNRNRGQQFSTEADSFGRRIRCAFETGAKVDQAPCQFMTGRKAVSCEVGQVGRDVRHCAAFERSAFRCIEQAQFLGSLLRRLAADPKGQSQRADGGALQNHSGESRVSLRCPGQGTG